MPGNSNQGRSEGQNSVRGPSKELVLFTTPATRSCRNQLPGRHVGLCVFFVGGVPYRLNKDPGCRSRVYVRVRLLRRACTTCGEVGWVPAHWVGGE